MAYFQDNEQILYLSSDKLEKQEIEDGINRKLDLIRTIESLVEEIEGSVARQGRATIIVTDTMADEFNMHLSHLVRAFATMDKRVLKIVEIGIGEVFEGAMTFGDVLSFIEFVRKERRVEYIEEVEAQGTVEAAEEGRVLRELLVEVDAAREKVETYEKHLGEKEEELLRVSADYQKLKTTVSHVYEVEKKNLVHEIEKYEEELSELKRVIKIEREKIKDYEKELGECKSINIGLELDKKSLEGLSDDRKRENRALTSEMKSYKNQIEKLQNEKIEIIKSRVDAEEHVLLSKELDKERGEKIELEKDFMQLKVENRKKEFDISGLLEDIEELRMGEDDIQTYGRTQKLDEHKFESMNLIYIKVVNDLPYLMSALKEMVKIIKEQFGGRTHVMVLRNDEGLDGMYYDGMQLYGTIGDVREGDENFLLHPTRKMFTGADKFERNVNTLVVLDYIRSPKYYLSTNAFGRVITVVRDSDMIRKYGLTGTPVSLDSGSLLDIRYDDRIDKADLKQTREAFIRTKVENWLSRIGLTNT